MKRSVWVCLASACVSSAMLLASPLSQPQRDILLYNHSPSIPVGFYLRTPGRYSVGAIATVRARDVALAYATSKHFADEDDRFIKRIAAAPGSFVCAMDDQLVIDGVVMAAMPNTRQPSPWRQCRRLHAEEYFLLGDRIDSFDSRYFGPVAGHQIEGIWRPLL